MPVDPLFFWEDYDTKIGRTVVRTEVATPFPFWGLTIRSRSKFYRKEDKEHEEGIGYA
jgi:hypothetical protein